MSDLYEDSRYCGHCDEFTPHLCRDGRHERDSSGDYKKCQKCGWFQFGFMAEPAPPGGE